MPPDQSSAPPGRGDADAPPRPGGYALWLFDFDNTIAALEPAVDWAASRRELEPWLRARGIDDELFIRIPRGNLPLYDALYARFTVEVRAGRAPEPDAALIGFVNFPSESRAILEGASALIERYEMRGVPVARELPGAIEFLRRLRELGAASVIVTSNSSRTVAAWFEAHGAGAIMPPIVGRDSGLALKPSPAMVIHALARSATAPRDAIFVGDSEADFRAASAIGVRFAGIAARPELRARLIGAGAADSQIFASPAMLARAVKV
ncbi:MAG TPA: HAD-IA family hydrolase [Candidatus Binataceae bacterium]|nr:HAD-IA family hydrolase [Candidatus Binataceae bacterium]